MVERVLIKKDADVAAAELAAVEVAGVVAMRGGCRVAITGGSAAVAVGGMRERLGAAWRRVRLTWIDERCVPFADPESNRGTAYRRGWLSERDQPASELPLWLDDDAPERAIARVQRELTDRFENQIDVVLFGLGEDGHVASLFPGHPICRATTRLAYLDDSPKPPARRVSLTADLLGAAPRKILLATGEGKRAALTRIIRGDPKLLASTFTGLVVVTDLHIEGGRP